MAKKNLWVSEKETDRLTKLAVSRTKQTIAYARVSIKFWQSELKFWEGYTKKKGVKK